MRLISITIIVVCIAVVANFSGCSFYYSSNSTSSRTTIHDTMPSCSLKGIQLALPTVGLFIGVSNYDESAQVWTTPAHSISAAMYREIFFQGSGIPQGGYIADPHKTIRLDTRQQLIRYSGANIFGDIIVLQYVDGSVYVKDDHGDYTFALASGIKNTFPTKGRTIIAHLENNTIVRWSNGEDMSLLMKNIPEDAEVLVDSKGRWIIIHEGNQVLVYDCGIGFNKPVATLKDDCLTRVFLDIERDQLIVGNCQAVNVYSLVDLEADPLPFEGTFRKDDLAFAQQSNCVALRRADSHLVIVGIDDGQVKADFHFYGEIPPMFALSGDSKLLVTKNQYLDSLEVYKVLPDMKKKPSFYRMTSIRTKNPVKEFHFSPIRQTISYVLENGEAGVWTHGSSTVKLRLSQPALLARFAADGENIRVIDTQSSLRTFQYRPPDPRSNQAKLALLADLKLDPRGELGKSTAWQLRRLDGMRGLVDEYDDFWKNTVEEEGGWSYIGEGKPVSRIRIEEAMIQLIDMAEETMSERGQVMLVFYISAHGWIGPDGKSYILPADADYDDPDTWMSLEAIFEPISNFLSDGEKDTTNRRAIVIVDSCQNSRSDAPLSLQIPSFDSKGKGYFIVTTSPGEYAWHWTASMQISGYQYVHKSTSWGFPPPPKPKQGPILKRLSSNMSCFPLASQCSLSHHFRDANNQKQGWIGPVEWFTETHTQLQYFLRNIPEAAQTGAKQSMRVYTTNGGWDDPLFNYQRPYEKPNGKITP